MSFYSEEFEGHQVRIQGTPESFVLNLRHKDGYFGELDVTLVVSDGKIVKANKIYRCGCQPITLDKESLDEVLAPVYTNSLVERLQGDPLKEAGKRAIHTHFVRYRPLPDNLGPVIYEDAATKHTTTRGKRIDPPC